jgi:predicted alpha/beta hydrolase family esterase
MGSVLNDIRVVIPNLPKCPDFTIPEIGLEVVKCLKTVSRRFKGEIILVGHQSGGHLAAKMASKGVLSEEVLSKINHVMAISPITDLRPLIYTKRKDDLKLTEEIAQIESLVDLELAENIPVTIWVGADERSIYIEQAKLLASKWSCPWFQSKDKHHFDIIDGLETKSSKLMNVLLSSFEKKYLI